MLNFLKEFMELILLPKQSVKTNRLVERAAERGFRIVCSTIEECARLQEVARGLGAEIKEPMSFDEFIAIKGQGMKTKGFIIDDADKLLKQMCIMNNAPLITMSMKVPEKMNDGTETEEEG